MAMHHRQKFGCNSQLRSPYVDIFRLASVQLLSARFQVGLILKIILFQRYLAQKFQFGLIQTIDYYILPQKQMSQKTQLNIRDFEVLKQLGSGSFGKVKLVKKISTEVLYAMKTVLLNRLNQKQKENALNEVRLLASIDIPTVIKYEGSFFNLQTNQLCVLMEYADGGDLQNKIIDRENKQPGQGFQEKAIWKLAFEILQGLRSLHKSNIIHRDIKSANIFFVKGVAKLGDLNVSKFTEDGFCSTQTGTPYYTSPEIWSGQKYGNKCDIWSLGCLIYEMCTLRVPFKASDFPSLYRRITKGQYSEIPSKYSNQLKSFIRMCLTTQEEMRPSASQLLNGSMFHALQREFESVKGGEVNMMDTIRCPKVLKLLNSRLPKAKNDEIGSKKMVTFASKKDLDQQRKTPLKQNILSRKIRSQKMIKWNEEQQPKLTKLPLFRLPRTPKQQKEQVSQKSLANGLSFSTKKLRIKPTSTKLIMMDFSHEEHML